MLRANEIIFRIVEFHKISIVPSFVLNAEQVAIFDSNWLDICTGHFTWLLYVHPSVDIKDPFLIFRFPPSCPEITQPWRKCGKLVHPVV